MADDTNKPVETVAATPAASTAITAASAKPSAPKPATRPRATKAAAPAVTKPARKRAPATAKATLPAAKKTVARPVARKSPPAKKATHVPEPFVAKGKEVKSAKVKKAKLVRDSFTMPDGEYALIAALKKRCLNVGVSAKKSEILRAAVTNLAKLSDASLVAAVRRLDVIKTGRPAKGSK
jgi:hypothetical protein